MTAFNSRRDRPANQSKRDAAVDAARRGWKVFPLSANGKVPLRVMTDWETQATCDVERVDRWWRAHPHHNIAIATGPSKLVVVDLDVAKAGEKPPPEWAGCGDGIDVFLALVDRHRQPLPVATYQVNSPSGGRHLYYRAPEGVELRNTGSRAGWKIDTRANGGYIVAAGSTIDRRPYQIARDVDELAVLPDWLTQLVTPPPPPDTTAMRPVSAGRDRVSRALERWIGRVLHSAPDDHNNTLNVAAYHLAPYIASGALPRHVVEVALQQAGEAVGQSPREAAATIRSGINAGLRRNPRSGT